MCTTEANKSTGKDAVIPHHNRYVRVGGMLMPTPGKPPRHFGTLPVIDATPKHAKPQKGYDGKTIRTRELASKAMAAEIAERS